MDTNRRSGAQGCHAERHGDPVIAMGMHFATAHQATVNDNPIGGGFTLHAKGEQTVGHDLDTQVESSVVFGLSAALGGEITIRDGKVEQSNFHQYPVLRMDQAPKVETIIMLSAEPPEGMGEPAVPPVAPAVANAVFALTGQRLRSLPLRL
eukprot:gene448-594_t